MRGPRSRFLWPLLSLSLFVSFTINSLGTVFLFYYYCRERPSTLVDYKYCVSSTSGHFVPTVFLLVKTSFEGAI